jgi:hypothetical protein
MPYVKKDKGGHRYVSGEGTQDGGYKRWSSKDG